MTTDDDRRVARRSDTPRLRHYTLTSRPARPVSPRLYAALGVAGLAVVLLLLLGGTLLAQADTSPDERPRLLRGLADAVWFPEWTSQAATPSAQATTSSARAPAPPPAPRPPSAPSSAAALPPQQPSPTVSRATPTSPPLVGRADSHSAAIGPLPPAAHTPVPLSTGLASSTPTLAVVALLPPRTATPTLSTFAAAPAFGVTAAPATKTPLRPTLTLVPPTPTLPPPPTAVPTLPPSPSPSPQPSVVVAVAPPSLPPTPTPPPPPTATLFPSPTALPRDYKLGDTVDITQVLKGFAFTGHWPNSMEGIYATDWYPRSATQPCANSHRLPLAVPVAGKWRLASQMSPLGGTQYTLIGELDDGNSVAFTHVDRDVLTGRVAANTVVGFVGISGLEPFDAAGLNPSHAHTAWNDRLVPNWDGDAGNRPARDFFGQYGFQVEIRDPASGATPQSYMMRQGCGGMLGVPRSPCRG